MEEKFNNLDARTTTDKTEPVISASQTETQKIAAAILDLLKRKAPCEPAEVIQSLSDKHDPWQVREVIWDLTANAAAELTWNRKLKLGRHSNLRMAAA